MNADEADARGHETEPPIENSTEESSNPLDRSDDDRADDDRAEAAPRSRRRTVLRRLLISVGVLALVLAMIIGGGIWFVSARYAGNVARISDVFGGLDQSSRPAPATSAADPGGTPTTFLLVGSDTRSHPASGTAPDGRSDAIMIARLSADRQHAQLVSIPRDSWVPIPGHGTSKINAAYAWGGATLLIQTVEQLTGVRIDHYVAVDFDGINQVTDALGGVDVTVAATTTNGPYTFTAGPNHITGEMARWYLGQRHELAGGDFDRVKRQQTYLRSVFNKLFSSNTFTDPGKLDSALRALTSAVSIDDTLSSTDLLTLAYSMRNLSPAHVAFFTAPVLGTGMEGAASVVYLDQVTGQRMWDYLKTDSLAQNAGEFSRQALGDNPR
jgi:LCP family protein required for cell wall assembly